MDCLCRSGRSGNEKITIDSGPNAQHSIDRSGGTEFISNLLFPKAQIKFYKKDLGSISIKFNFKT
jgi:hypothetical protein